MLIVEPAFVVVGVAIVLTAALMFTAPFRRWFWPSSKVALIVLGAVVISGGLNSVGNVAYITILAIVVAVTSTVTIWNFVQIRRGVRRLER